MPPVRQRMFTIGSQAISARWRAMRSPSMGPTLTNKIVPRAQEEKRKVLTREEWLARRLLRREKQRAENVVRAANMDAARLQAEPDAKQRRHHAADLKGTVYVGCSGWFYWKWRGLFYPEGMPTGEWFQYYAKSLDTVEINASFYSWPTVANVKAWKRQAKKRNFVYTVKACELITHIKRFKGTKTLIRDFGMIADILGDRMGCFLFQLSPSYLTTRSRMAVERRRLLLLDGLSGELASTESIELHLLPQSSRREYIAFGGLLPCGNSTGLMSATGHRHRPLSAPSPSLYLHHPPKLP